MNKKGFSMIEMLATVAILGILSLTAVSNIQGAAEKQKVRTYINDARRMITAARGLYIADTTIPEPDLNTCIIFRLSELNMDNVNVGPNKGKYLNNYSYVTINYDYKKKKYYYGVQLLEETKKKLGEDIVTGYRGITYKNALPYNPTEKFLGVESRANKLEKFTKFDQLKSSNCKWRIDPTGSNYGSVTQNIAVSEVIYSEEDLDDAKLYVESVDLAEEAKSVRVYGASYKMDTVESVSAVLDIVSLNVRGSGTYESDAQLRAYDKNNNPVGVSVEPNTIRVKVKILDSHKTVPIKVYTRGTVAISKMLVSANTSVPSVTIWGRQKYLDNVSEIPIYVNIDGLADPVEVPKSISRPTGVRVISNESTMISIDIQDDPTYVPPEPDPDETGGEDSGSTESGGSP